MKYTVYEVFPDGKRFFRFESDDHFECEVYVDHHKYSVSVRGKLIITESNINRLYEAIKQKQEDLTAKVELFGSADNMSRHALYELEGMEKAFEIVAGTNVTDYLLKTMEE